MKYLQLKPTKNQIKQLKNLAKIAYEADPTRPYLRYIEFVMIGDIVRISASNGHILVDLHFIAHDCETLEDGFKFNLHSEHFLDIKDEWLQFDFQDKIIICKDYSKIEVDYYNDYVDLDRVRIVESGDLTIGFDLGELKKIMKAFGTDKVKLTIPKQEGKPFLIKNNNSSALLMPMKL